MRSGLPQRPTPVVEQTRKGDKEIDGVRDADLGQYRVAFKHSTLAELGRLGKLGE